MSPQPVPPTPWAPGSRRATSPQPALCGHEPRLGKPNSNTTVVETIDGDPTKATIFGYDTGAAMVTGTAAAARVGFMYYGGNGATHFNHAAQLFDASIQWAASRSAHRVPTRRHRPDHLVHGQRCHDRPLRLHRVSRHPRATLNAAGTVTERTISLPGGVLVTTRTAGNVWSYPNLHGDVVATTDATGVKQGATRAYDPFGNLLGDSGCRTTPPERSTTAGTANNNDPPTTKPASPHSSKWARARILHPTPQIPRNRPHPRRRRQRLQLPQRPHQQP